MDKDADRRGSAARALGAIGERAHSAIPALITALGDQGFYVRCGAADALGAIGESAHSAVPALITALRDKDYSMRGSAASALGEIVSKAYAKLPQSEITQVTSALSTASLDKMEYVANSAQEAISKIKESGRNATGGKTSENGPDQDARSVS